MYSGVGTGLSCTNEGSSALLNELCGRPLRGPPRPVLRIRRRHRGCDRSRRAAHFLVHRHSLAWMH